MKNRIKVFTMAVCATMGVGLVAVRPVSAAGAEQILVYSRENGAQDSTVCRIYDSESSSIYNECNSSYGSYNSTSKTLTLGAGINGLVNGHVTVNIDGVTISSSSNIATTISINSDGAILNFGNYSFTDTPYVVSNASDSTSNSSFGSNLVVRGGTINVPYLSSSGSLKIEGGVINTAANSVSAISASGGELEISGGTINVPGCSLLVGANSSLTITNGVINAENIRTTGLSSYGDIKISGGEINIKSAETPAGFGILLSEGKNLIVDGGNLTIDGFDWGINGTKSKIYFNGGNTVIKNSIHHTIWILRANDPKNDIIFGDDMGIKGNTYVFYDDESTGIADSGEVTIAEGYTYRKHYGWENIGGDSNSGDESESSIKVPNTGIFSGENGGAIIMAISMGALAAVAGGAYVASYAIRRRSVRAKFLKK